MNILSKLVDKFNDVSLEIIFLKNEITELEKKSSFEQWLPFEMHFQAGEEEYNYAKETSQAFNLFEIERFIEKLQEIIETKESGGEITAFEFSNLDASFDLNFYDPLEEGEIYVDFWINLGTYYPEKEVGYNKGYRFIVTIACLKQFVESLSEYKNSILR